jgi:hypothetical protein
LGAEKTPYIYKPDATEEVAVQREKLFGSYRRPYLQGIAKGL